MKEKNKALELYADLADGKVDEVKGKLTKAKKIIKNLLDAFASNDFFDEEELNAMAEAEQFLKE